MSVAPYTVGARTVSAARVDSDISAFADDFDSGDNNLLARGWRMYQSALVATQDIADGELDYEVTAGAAAGSFWFNADDGNLVFKLITGDADVRIRVRVRNTADSGSPPADNFRLFVLAAHDPDRATNLNYCHVGAGSTADTGSRVEWKTTDDSVSTYDDNGADIAAPLDVDLRLVRVGQVFTPYWRLSSASGNLRDNVGWNALQTMDREDNTTPARASAVALPDTLQWGFSCYSNDATHNVRGHVVEAVAL